MPSFEKNTERQTVNHIIYETSIIDHEPVRIDLCVISGNRFGAVRSQDQVEAYEDIASLS